MCRGQREIWVGTIDRIAVVSKVELNILFITKQGYMGQKQWIQYSYIFRVCVCVRVRVRVCVCVVGPVQILARQVKM